MSLQITKRIRPVLSLGLPLELAAACIASAPSSPKTMTLYNDASADGYVSHEKTDGLGDKILWRSDMLDVDGDRVGTGSGHCTKLDADENFFCAFTIQLDGRGIISGHGVQLTEPTVSTYPITGGTGEFEGITGEAESWPNEDRSKFIYDLEYRLPGQ